MASASLADHQRDDLRIRWLRANRSPDRAAVADCPASTCQMRAFRRHPWHQIQRRVDQRRHQRRRSGGVDEPAARVHQEVAALRPRRHIGAEAAQRLAEGAADVIGLVGPDRRSAPRPPAPNTPVAWASSTTSSVMVLRAIATSRAEVRPVAVHAEHAFGRDPDPAGACAPCQCRMQFLKVIVIVVAIAVVLCPAQPHPSWCAGVDQRSRGRSRRRGS